MHRVCIVGDVKVPIRQLLTKSYRPRTGRPRWRRERGDLLGEIRGSNDERLPKALAAGCVEGRKDLPAAGIKHGQASAAPFPRHGRQRRTGTGRLLAEGATESIQGADADSRHARAGRQAPGRRQPDSDPDEGPRAAPDGDPSHLLPATTGVRRALYLGKQRGRVPRASIGCQAERRLVQHRTATHRADGGVSGRRVEADDRLPLGAQLSQ